jgi:hypothetical protein
MKFTAFATVATFFALVVANPVTASDNVDDAVRVAETACSGQWCYNIYADTSQSCCSGSSCNYGSGFYYYCT